MLFPNLKLYLIIAGIIALIVAGLTGALALQIRANRVQAEDNAKVDIKNLQDDAANTKKNQEDLYASLNDIRIQSKIDQNKPAIPKTILHDRSAADLETYVNNHTKSTLHSFEVLTGNVPKKK